MARLRTVSSWLAHDAVLPWLFFGLLAVVAFWPVVFAGASATSQDGGSGVSRPYEGHVPESLPVNDPAAFAWQDEPLVELVSDELRAGRLPLWNPHVGGGAPLAAALESGAFSPLHWPLFIDSSPLTWDIFVIGRLVAAAALTFYFCRLIGLGKAPALVAGALYGFAGYLVIFLQYYFIDGEVALPGVLIAVELLLRRPRSWPRTALLGMTLALLILAGNPQVTLLNGLFAGGYALARVVFMPGVGAEGRGGALGALAGGATLAVALSAFLLLPFIEYWRIAWNNHQQLALGENTLQVSAVLSAFVPEFFGPIHDHWLDLGNDSFLPYLGFSVLILAPLAAARIRESGLSTARWFFVGTAGFLVLKIYGIDLAPLPGLEFPGSLGALPGFKDIWWTKYSGTLAFSAAMLSGIGLNAVLKADKASSGWLAAGGAFAFLGLVVGSVLFFRARIEAVSAWEVVAEGLIVTGLLAAALAGVLLMAYRGLLDRRLMGAVVVLIVAADVALWIPKDRWDRYDSLGTEQPHVAFLIEQQQTEQPFRFYGVGFAVQPVTASAYGIYDLRNFDSLMVEHYRDYMTELVHRDVPPGDRLSTGHRDSPSVFNNPAVDAMNVRYMIIERTRARGADGDLLAEGGYELVHKGVVRVYENPNALQRGYLVSSFVVAETDEEAMEIMKAEDFDPRRVAVLQGRAPEEFAGLEVDEPAPHPLAPSPRGVERGEGGMDGFVFSSYESQEVIGTADASGPSLLVFSDTYYPGWKAYVDGEEVEIERVNLTMRGVFLRAGEHEVRFAYEPASFRYGVVISVTAAVATIVALLWPVVRGWVVRRWTRNQRDWISEATGRS